MGRAGFQPVRPAELHSAESIKHRLETIWLGNTGRISVLRSAVRHPAVLA